MPLPEWSVCGLPPGITAEQDQDGAIAVGLRHDGCEKVTIVSRKAVESRQGEPAPCFHCFRTATLPTAQGTLL